MGRADWKRGRFSAEVETQEISEGLRGYQPAFGDHIDYFRFSHGKSKKHSVYDEAVEVGRQFAGSVDVPVLDVRHGMGDVQGQQDGFYTVDSLQVSASFRQLSRTGLTEIDLRTNNYLRDRIAYDGRLFRVREMRVLGQIQRSDVVVEMSAVQLKPDELVNDPQFAQYVVDPSAAPLRLGYNLGGYGNGLYD
jgi:hypothetical protein